MTNYNERLEAILTQLEAGYTNPYVTYPQDDISHDEAKQAITSLIKELVAEAKPNAFKFDDGQNDATHFYNKAVSEYQQNLLKALEEV